MTKPGQPATLPAVVRCITLLRLLVERGQITHDEAQKYLGRDWPQRTFERDIATLRDAGVKIDAAGRQLGAGSIKFLGWMRKRPKSVSMGALKDWLGK